MTTVFNLVILDESGSMDCIRKETIANCVETVNTIRSAQKKYADTQRHLLSIYLFQENRDRESHYLVRNLPVDDVKPFTADDYLPWGGTPLFDAVGSTLTDLEAIAATHEDAIGSVTIITDGYENASKRFSGPMVASIISRLKEKGWNINIIGANIDVDALASHLNIDNALKFTQTSEGTRNMTNQLSYSRNKWYSEVHESSALPEEDRLEARKCSSKSFFDK